MYGCGWYAARQKVAVRKYLNSLKPPLSKEHHEEETHAMPKEDKPELIDKTSLLYKDVSSLDKINEYNIITLWGITDPYLQDALKALLKLSPQSNSNKHTGIQDVINLLELWKSSNA